MIALDYIWTLTLWEFIYHTIGCYYHVLLARFIIATIWTLIKVVIPLNDVLKKYSSTDSK